jgi:hypothetical protein
LAWDTSGLSHRQSAEIAVDWAGDDTAIFVTRITV